MTDPLVSVVIPTHNRARLLERAIRSVLRQTYANLECIVVDDGSEDDTPERARRIDDPRLRYIRLDPTQHVSRARNAGIAAARGSLVAFLDDDDEWLPEKLQRQVALLLRLPPTVGMVYTWMEYVDPTGAVIREHRPMLRGHVFDQVLDRQRIGGCPTLLVRRKVIDEIGGFDPELKRGNDGDFIRRVALRYEVDLVPESLVRVHTGHPHERITGSDASAIEHAIRGNSAKLEKFSDVLHRYPRQTAAIHSRIGLHYAQLGQWAKSAPAFARAARTSLRARQVYGDLWRAAWIALATSVTRVR